MAAKFQVRYMATSRQTPTVPRWCHPIAPKVNPTLIDDGGIAYAQIYSAASDVARGVARGIDRRAHRPLVR
jgi:hypothetical protein